MSVSYTHSVPGNGSIVTNSQQPNTVSISNVDTTSIVFHNLVTGAEYVFNITVENSYGSSSFTCGLTPHIIGKMNVKQWIIFQMININLSPALSMHYHNNLERK